LKSINSAIIDFLKGKPPQNPKEVVEIVAVLYGWENFEVKRALWKLTADGIAQFNDGMKTISLCP
jgi:hypothetical protein